MKKQKNRKRSKSKSRENVIKQLNQWAKYKETDTGKRLIEDGVDINAQDSRGRIDNGIIGQLRRQ